MCWSQPLNGSIACATISSVLTKVRANDLVRIFLETTRQRQIFSQDSLIANRSLKTVIDVLIFISLGFIAFEQVDVRVPAVNCRDLRVGVELLREGRKPSLCSFPRPIGPIKLVGAVSSIIPREQQVALAERRAKPKLVACIFGSAITILHRS